MTELDQLTNVFEQEIVAWLRSKNENASYIAYQLAKIALTTEVRNPKSEITAKDIIQQHLSNRSPNIIRLDYPSEVVELTEQIAREQKEIIAQMIMQEEIPHPLTQKIEKIRNAKIPDVLPTKY